MRWLIVLLGIRLAEAAAQGIWIDTDASIGAPWREVDDAFALVLAFHSPELRIAGISTTYGNAGLKRTTSVTRDLVRRFGAAAGLNESDVFAGVASRRESGRGTAANQALARALRKERLTYVALGPLTNLAAFIRQHPGPSRRLERVIFVGGKTPGKALTFGPTGALRIHDANVVKDPDAVRTLLNANIPIVLAPVETSSHLVLERERWRLLRHRGQAARFLQKKTGLWIWFWTGVVRHRGGPLFDSLAVMLAAKPEIVPTEERYAWVDSSGEFTATRRRLAGSHPVRFAVGPTTESEQLAVERLR